ncbi:MAG: GspH/FimT family pseudopilin [Burkholderiaceae bacterium]
MSALRFRHANAARTGCRAAGFTLIELMITIAIAAILLGLATPSFQNATLSSKLTGEANSLVASMRLARDEAIKRNATVTLCVSTNGTSCTTGGWQQGWIVLFTDTSASPNTNTVLQQKTASPNGYRITEGSGTSSLSFRPAGMAATPASMTVCRSTPTAGNQERVVTLEGSGRVTVKRTSTGTCS